MSEDTPNPAQREFGTEAEQIQPPTDFERTQRIMAMNVANGVYMQVTNRAHRDEEGEYRVPVVSESEGAAFEAACDYITRSLRCVGHL